MNYFELYGLPVSLNLDEQQVKRKFYELSKKYHPDFYIGEPEEKQREILELSTLNNKAFQVLSSFRKRIEYVLEMYGLLGEGDKHQLPQEFLMEMMEVNEALMELEFEAGQEEEAAVSSKVALMESALDAELHDLALIFDTDNEEQRKNTLLRIKDMWYRQKYLLRIRNTLNTFASR